MIEESFEITNKDLSDLSDELNDLGPKVRTYKKEYSEEDEDILKKRGGIEKLAELLKTDLEKGVEVDSIETRKRHFGDNDLKVKGLQNQEGEVMNDMVVKVIRSGEELEVKRIHIYPGDVVELKKGDEIPADGLIIKGSDIKVDESMVSGETVFISKEHNEKEADKMFLVGSSKMYEGECSMLVTATGLNSIYGKVISEIEMEQKGKCSIL